MEEALSAAAVRGQRAARAPRDPRRPHQPRQPRAVPRRPRAARVRQRTHAARDRGALPRPRPVQGGQRLARARRGRRAAARRRRAPAHCVRGDDLLARLGGDEFTVVAPGIDADDALRSASASARRSTTPFILAGLRTVVSVSVGVAIEPRRAQRHRPHALRRRRPLRGQGRRTQPRGALRRVDALVARRAGSSARTRCARRCASTSSRRGTSRIVDPRHADRSSRAEALARWRHPRARHPRARAVPAADGRVRAHRRARRARSPGRHGGSAALARRRRRRRLPRSTSTSAPSNDPLAADHRPAVADRRAGRTSPRSPVSASRSPSRRSSPTPRRRPSRSPRARSRGSPSRSTTSARATPRSRSSARSRSTA